MNKKLLLALLLLSAPATTVSSTVPEKAPHPASNECVILLHGLARTASSMEKLANTLEEVGYSVANIDYPSRHHAIPTLAKMAIDQGLSECREKEATTINFVTHSLGGILVREYLNKQPIEELKRVVMLGPPNQGSEVVDKLKNVPGFKALNGPAGLQLGTSKKDIPKQLGAVNFDTGIIAGTRSINLILSGYLPGIDDGKVTVENAKVAGMKDFMTLPVTHPMMMNNDNVIDQTLHFLRQGYFKRN